jgi:hypothetical protein
VRFGRRPNGPQEPGREFGEFVRQSLHAAADQVEPHADGLERIRARISSGPAHAHVPEAVAKGPVASGGFLADLFRRWSHQGGHARHAPRSARQWQVAVLRPAFAAGFAVFALGVALAVPPVRAEIGHLSSAAADVVTGQSARSSAGGTDGNGQPVAGVPGAVAVSGSGRPAARVSCSSPAATGHPTATASPTATQTTTPPTTPPTSPPVSPDTGTATTGSPTDTTTSPPDGTVTSPSDSPTQTDSPSPSPDLSPSGVTTSPSPSPTAIGSASAKRTGQATPSPAPCPPSAKPGATGTGSATSGETTSPSPSPSPSVTPDQSPSPSPSTSPGEEGGDGSPTGGATTGGSTTGPGATPGSGSGNVHICRILFHCKK